MKFFNKRILLTILTAAGIILLVLAGALVTYLNSPRFEEVARRYIEQQIELRTGGQTSLKKFQWSIRNQRVELDDLTIHGLEPGTSRPLAHFESIVVGLSLRSLIKHRLDLFELTVNRPEVNVLVDAAGRTNLPNPPPQPETGQTEFQISIDNFRIGGGIVDVNERRVAVDLVLTNVASALSYRNATRILSAHLGYDGTLQLDNGKPAIPYTLVADMDYTRGTVMAQTITLTSGGSIVKLQGRIDNALTKNIAGGLEYTATANAPFLNHFFTEDRFGGNVDAAGSLDFSSGHFSTTGNAVSKNIAYDEWNIADVKSAYAYDYPKKQLELTGISAHAVGGSAAGKVTIEELPGPSRVVLDLDYTNIDAAALARVYPWDPKYRIYSHLTGKVRGWFEGKFDRFELGGNATLAAYPPKPAPGMVSFPLDGSAGYEARPGQVRITNADVRFFSTTIQADGLIDEKNSNLRVALNSSSLNNAYFIYADANGAGSFNGTLSGPIRTPIFDGAVTLSGYRHGEWTIQEAAGNVRLDTKTSVADLRNVVVKQGQSQIALNGNTTLDGTKVDLRIQSSQVRAADVEPFTHRKLGGQFAGSIHLTSIAPLRFDGDVRASDLVVNDQSIQNIQGHVLYNDPAIEIQNLSAADGGATASGDAAYNPNTEAVKFNLRVNGLNLERLRSFGLPTGLDGIVQQAQFTGSGTRSRPDIRGQAIVQNLMFHGELFPQARLDAVSTASRLDLTLATGNRNLDLSAQIDTSTSDYPFTAKASFARYAVEKLAGFNQGTISVSGGVDVSGLLRDMTRLRGTGHIDNAQIRIQERLLQSTRPFSFDFNSDRLNLSNVSLTDEGNGGTGTGTEMAISGTVALTESAALNLDVKGGIELSLLSAGDPSLITGGSLNVDGHVGGTLRNPDLRGTAHFTNASLARRGFFTSLSALNGDMFFNENRVTLNNLQGQVGGGTIQVQGTGVLQNGQVDAMNIRVESNQVRLRYPEGLRTVVDGTVILRGSWAAPVLEGSLEIESMAYRSEFEQFLALFQTGSFENTASDLGRLKLSLHLSGSRNITIKNELADVDARVDLDIKGTVDSPALTGHVEASGGTLTFQGTKYEITRGNIDFVDPLRVEPVVDIQAETDLRDYRVILAISGKGNNLRLDMRSDPPLPQLEIVSLIAGGKTREELAQSGAAGLPSSEQLFQGGAASIMFDLLRSRVGSGRIGLLDLSRVRIDPFIGADSNPTARITLPLQVTKDLSITYSRDVSSDRQEIIQIEYFISKNVSVLATRDEASALGLDLRLRRRY